MKENWVFNSVLITADRLRDWKIRTVSLCLFFVFSNWNSVFISYDLERIGIVRVLIDLATNFVHIVTIS